MLYEFDFQLHIWDIFKLLTFILPVCLYLFSGSINNKIARYGVLTLTYILVFALVFVLLIFPLYSYFKINQYLKEDNFLTVSGEVYDFKTPENSFEGHNSESFSIDNINFEYYGTENYGYSEFLCNGGVVKGNGQKLEISYCYDPITKEIVICYIKSLT